MSRGGGVSCESKLGNLSVSRSSGPPASLQPNSVPGRLRGSVGRASALLGS